MTRTATALLAASLMVGCAGQGSPPADPRTRATQVDSVTTTLWRLEETTGTRCADAGPFRLDLLIGPGTRGGYARIGGGREFTRVIDSFLFCPYNPVFDPTGGLTIDAWILPRAWGQYEDTPIAARWTQEGTQQSWLFAVVGQNMRPPLARLPSPGYHAGLVGAARAGQLLFAFQPADASRPRTFYSTSRLILDRWTHVAVSYDGSVVRFFVDGRLDAQYATLGRIQATRAPLLIGNYFDTRRLTAFSGELRLESGDDNPYYAFEGTLDELRISSTARQVFPGIHP